MAIYLSAHITSIYATTILRDFLKPIEALRQPSPHASYAQISKVGLHNISSQRWVYLMPQKIEFDLILGCFVSDDYLTR